MHVISTIGSDVLGRCLLDDESVYSAFVLDVVLHVRSKFLAVLEPVHLLSLLRQLAFQTDVFVDLVQLYVLEFFGEPDFFHCTHTHTHVSRNDLDTHVCLCSPSSINWYQPKGGDAL